MELQLTELLFLYCVGLGTLGIFIWVFFVLYLKSKWLLLLEDVLDDGVRFYTLNVFLSGQGVLHYATIFISKFHARRYGMLKTRNNVPKHVQRLFVFSFFWFIFSGVLMCIGAAILAMYDL